MSHSSHSRFSSQKRERRKERPCPCCGLVMHKNNMEVKTNVQRRPLGTLSSLSISSGLNEAPPLSEEILRESAQRSDTVSVSKLPRWDRTSYP